MKSRLNSRRARDASTLSVGLIHTVLVRPVMFCIGILSCPSARRFAPLSVGEFLLLDTPWALWFADVDNIGSRIGIWVTELLLQVLIDGKHIDVSKHTICQLQPSQPNFVNLSRLLSD